jgi:hypothetical protein
MGRTTLYATALVGMLAATLATASAQAQTTPLEGQIGTADIPSGVQRVDIVRSGSYEVLGDVSPNLVGGLQPAAGEVIHLKRMNIVVAPGYLHVVTGVPELELQPVAFETSPPWGNPIDVYFDATVEYDAAQTNYGFQPDGFRPYPQTPDITVNPYEETVVVDNHLSD